MPARGAEQMMRLLGALKSITGVLAGTVIFAAALCLPPLSIMGLAWVSANLADYANAAAQIALVICVFILLPFGLFRATRAISAHGLLISSFIFGLATW